MKLGLRPGIIESKEYLIPLSVNPLLESDVIPFLHLRSSWLDLEI